MMAKDLSVLIPARNEIFLAKTIENVLDNAEADTEVIAVLDGYWPDPPIQDRKNVVFIHVTDPIGQRGATNIAARASKAKFVMKLDAHCAVDKGFDRKLMADCEPDWTVIPRMYNLHAFDWECPSCHKIYYQADKPSACACGVPSDSLEMKIVWQPRLDRKTDFGRFDNTLHWQYWRRYHHRRPDANQDIADVMSSVGACFLMHRDHYLALDGLDEGHGFWGQVGTEVACKSWLSGGRQVVNKKTWFSHLFRVGTMKFPYPLSGNAQERARVYSRDLWLNDKWPKAVHPLSWLIDKFKPIPSWHEGAK